MRDAEDPAAKVFPGFSQLEMSEEAQEDLLDDFFRLMHG
jgi:hypothetical protein